MKPFQWIIAIIPVLIGIWLVTKEEATLSRVLKAYANRSQYRTLMQDAATTVYKPLINAVSNNDESTTPDAPLVGRTVLVTGGNRDLGSGIVAHFLAGGARLILPCRNLPKDIPEAQKKIGLNAFHAIKKFNNNNNNIDNELISMLYDLSIKNILFIQMDLASMNSIRTAVDNISKILNKKNKIDILINNAELIPTIHNGKTADGFESSFGVNFLGTVCLTMFLKEAGTLRDKGSTIIMVSSENHRIIKLKTPIDDQTPFGSLTKTPSFSNAMDRYGYSKLVLLTWTYELQRKWKDHKIYSICPGPVASEIARDAPWPLKDLVMTMMSILFPSPTEAALPILRLAIEYDIPKDYADGIHYHMGQPREGGAGSSDLESGKWVWEKTEELLLTSRAAS